MSNTTMYRLIRLPLLRNSPEKLLDNPIMIQCSVPRSYWPGLIHGRSVSLYSDVKDMVPGVSSCC